MSISTQCLECKYYTGLCTCKAFPEKIPQEIFNGTFDHINEYPGDNGIRFEKESNISKSEKIIPIKRTAKRKAHKRRITFEGKTKDPAQFKLLDITGIPEMDQKISFCIYEFDKRINEGESYLDAIENMVDSKSKLDYIQYGCDRPINHVMDGLSKIISESNKSLTGDLNINIEVGIRSYYNQRSDEINIGAAKNPFSNIYHEFGHHLEASKKSIHRACVKFHDKRTEGEDEVKLSDLIPGIGYGDEEVTKPDKFINPYVGRVYDPYMSSTEILSYGIEKLTTPMGVKVFYKEDKEHFALVLAAITGRI